MLRELFFDSVPPLDRKNETRSLLCLFNHETRWCRWGGAMAPPKIKPRRNTTKIMCKFSDLMVWIFLQQFQCPPTQPSRCLFPHQILSMPAPFSEKEIDSRRRKLFLKGNDNIFYCPISFNFSASSVSWTIVSKRAKGVLSFFSCRFGRFFCQFIYFQLS